MKRMNRDTSSAAIASTEPRRGMRHSASRRGYLQLYLILLPSIVLLVIFKYVPLNGLVIAFQDYNVFRGIFDSPFVGFDNFRRAFANPDFIKVVRNTLVINGVKTLFYIPLPVILAVFISEIPSLPVKRIVQTAVYLPHFLSWVIVAGIFASMLAVNGGLVNEAIRSLGGDPVRFMYDNRYFRSVIVVSAMWKEIGWGAIIHLAAIASIDPNLYEAAVMDGASKFRQTWHITLPGIKGTILLVALLSLGNILERSFEQVFVMYNPVVYETADIINTYVYRYGLGQMEYSYSTAIGLFNGLVGLILIVTTNALARRYLDRSMW